LQTFLLQKRTLSNTRHAQTQPNQKLQLAGSGQAIGRFLKSH